MVNIFLSNLGCWLDNFGAKTLKSRRHKMRMVADAVLVEPVSNENSLLTGKLTGNFVKSAHLGAILKLTREQIQRLAAKFPTQQNRELFRRNREFVRSEQGI